MGLGDRFRAAFGIKPRVRFDQPAATRFAVSQPVLPVDQLLLHWWQKNGGVIDRPTALSVPAVLRGRNMICSVSTLPLEAVSPEHRVRSRALFQQIDPNTANVVTLAQTIEDLLFDAVAWWRVIGFDADGYPSRCVRYAPDQVSLQPPAGWQRGHLPSGLATEGVVWMEGKAVPFDEVIRFDSPNPGLLTVAADAIGRAVALGKAASLYASSPRRRGYFRPADGVDPAEDEDIEEMLEAWERGSQQRIDGYVPAALEYNAIQDSTPAELQLVQMQQRASLDIANALGIDPEDLGISTTSRTYQNATDRRMDRINETLAPYMRAITDRLAMPDVTPPEERVRFGLDDYLKADPKTRAEVQQIHHAIGATDAAEIRDQEGLPPRTITPPGAASEPAAALPPRRVPSSTGAGFSSPASLALGTVTTFARETGLTFDADLEFAVDVARRTITGLAVPYGQAARSRGVRWRFAPDAIRWKSVNRVKLLRDHDNSQAIGVATALEQTPDGLVATFRVSPGARGDEALALAVDGVLDGLSIGVDFSEDDTIADPEHPGARLIQRAALREISLTAVPSFDDSRLTSVRAARDGDPMDTCEHCHAQITTGVAHTCTPANTPATDPASPATAAVPANPAVTFSAEQFSQLLERVGGAQQPAVRQVVNPAARPMPNAQVAESLPYRFSRQGGRTVFQSDAEHDLSTDIMAATMARLQNRVDVDAERRVDAMIAAAFSADNATSLQFDVDRTDVAATTPNRHRPDMWLPQMDYVTPLWDMINAGTTDGRSFDVPKFNSSSGLVAPATEGVEPAPGAYTAGLQTITPTQVWGKIEITRQAWRAGGSPQLSGIIWDQMLREYYEDRENAVATFLNTLTAATDITLTGTPLTTPDNDDDQQTVTDLEAAITDLQFVRGGNRFRAFAVQQNLYRVLSRVKDDAGRPLYPQLNPSNANGTAQPLWRYLNIGGTLAVPAWALGAGGGTAPSNSWLFDPTRTLGWASAPERMFWDFGATVQTANIPQLSHVTLGIYGDVAFANLDIAAVRQVIFDPSI